LTNYYRYVTVSFDAHAEAPPFASSQAGLFMDKDWRKLISQPEHAIKKEKDIFVPLRDGVKLAVDVYRPDAAWNWRSTAWNM
jgi:predicted acyl esterase